MNQTLTSRNALVLAAAMVCLVAVSVEAAVVTSNNLTTQSLGNLTATTGQAYTSFSVTPGLLTGTTVTAYSIKTGAFSENPYPTHNYSIIGVSQYSDPTTAQLSAIYAPFIQGGTAFNPSKAASQLIFVPSTAASSLNYHLGVGDTTKYSPGIGPNWDWQADNITVYTPALDDAGRLGVGYRGNLVPNASFENSSINFFSVGTVTADASAPHGGNVLQNISTVDAHIGVPVEVGKTYVYSIWVNRTGGDVQLEWGFSVPADGGAVAAGNSSQYITGAGWRERAGSFTPAAGQTMWYFGGMASGATVWFDSVLVQQIPEPGTLALGAMATCALLRRRRG